ncbi:ATP-dependent nuclease [Candidatus Endoriftia persephone]|uniref:AAA family ATPase n=2 Tax=Gammaproteobacteria TaxID=1236 RepID=A0A9J6ZUD4_9GAMM|nr:AAA family ATPase [Candidatus Endoriftia persephone]USF86393.1 AAA family ATPase [Candidatus Endoriftia persephone]
MKIDYIEVKKFRSIDQCRITFNSVNAIVGQNNSGKSAVIRAMNAFFNPETEIEYFYQGKHSYTNNSTPRITLGFSDVSGTDNLDRYSKNNELEVQFSFTNKNKITYKYKNNNAYSVAPDGLIDDIKKKIAFVYIPPNRSPEQLRWEENTLIKELIEEYLKIETKKRDTLTPKFKSAANYLESGALKKISRDVESYYSLRHKFNFSLNFDRHANFLSFINGIQMHVNELGVNHHLDDCGTGLQSLTIIAFHRVLANLRHRNIVLGLEEPETNLHPQAQRELINSIIEDSEKSGIAQIVITTHSTVIIDNIEHERISLVRKIPDDRRGFKSKLFKLNDTFFHDHGLEEFKYYQFHLYRNSDFFYANYVILVESKNDAEVIKHLARRESINLDLYGISIINIDGVKNLAYPLYIVRDLGIPYLAILDKDYFLPYLNDKLDLSRNVQGLPKYRAEYKNNNLLEELIETQRARDQILSKLNSNHTAAMDLLLRYKLICMNYNLEMDLLCSDKAVELMSQYLGLTEEQSNRKFLLEERKKTIKAIDSMLYVLERLDNRNLPNSYKKIKKEIIEITKRC